MDLIQFFALTIGERRVMHSPEVQPHAYRVTRGPDVSIPQVRRAVITDPPARPLRAQEKKDTTFCLGF